MLSSRGNNGGNPRPHLSVTVCASAEVANLETIWLELQSRADTSFFLTWDWIGCWLRESQLDPYLLTVRHDARVVGLALFQPSRRRGHFFIGAHALMLHQAGDPGLDAITIEHNTILADRDYVTAAHQACLDFLVDQCREGKTGGGLCWDELHLGGVSSPETLRTMANRVGLMTSYRNYSHSWAVDLAAIRQSGASYLDQLSANTRYQIRRAIRLYEVRGGLTVTSAATPEIALRQFADMKDLHQHYWTGRGHAGSFASPFFERFHRALLTACVPNGTVELVCVAVGGDPIGYLYNFIHDGWVCAYQTGFKYEDDGKLKPGLVSHYLCIARHLQQGARRYDFLAGGDRYKASLARPGPDIATLIMQRPLLKLRVENAARRFKNGSRTALVTAARRFSAERAGP